MDAVPIWFVDVVETAFVTPRMVRVTLGGDDLAGIDRLEPDQQVKLYFPREGQSAPRMPEPDGDFARWYTAFTAIPEDERPVMRSYTIRRHDRARRMVDIDFVLHGDTVHIGPATRWARTARPGDTIAMFGPSSTFARPVPLMDAVTGKDWLLLAGDETALPAIGSILEALPAGHRALAFVEVADAGEEQRLRSRGEVTVRWLHRGNGETLVEAVRDAEFPDGEVFAWLAAEAGVVRALRRHLVNERGVSKRDIEFTGHWRRSLSQDDAPTEEDLAEAKERMAGEA
ncbi:siderophore-interacting protein [Amycolatopsis sp. CA-230715]|uniref:siderophore-interacting protein n=1 Tax=Amycolatopsis sp. CA-230715 TaxID=2745196 RepID=UPI001C01517B|nr:siderophore-interacting protein [Amycolatopsis sp. CA-230715]QWF77618.1 Vibriobactin utilization protein ViuB [Amycolatopsis sp. CA-230715]